MKQNAQTFDIYRFINSPDVAEHCQKINYQFTTTEMSKLIYMSRISDEEKMQGYKWLIENASDDIIPNKYRHIPYFALGHGGYTKEEIRSHTKTYNGRDSVIEYLKQCTASGEFTDLKDGCNNLSAIDFYIPHPFKVGDIVRNIITGKIYVIDSVRDGTNAVSGEKPRSQFTLGLYLYKEPIRSSSYVFMMEVSDLCYYNESDKE